MKDEKFEKILCAEISRRSRYKKIENLKIGNLRKKFENGKFVTWKIGKNLKLGKSWAWKLKKMKLEKKFENWKLEKLKKWEFEKKLIPKIWKKFEEGIRHLLKGGSDQ